MNSVLFGVHRTRRDHVAGPLALGLDEPRHEIFIARQDEDVGFVAVKVLRQSLVGLASDCRERKRPSESKWAVAAAGVVRQGKLRAETGSPRTSVHRDTQRPSTCDRIRREFLANPANSTAALRQV